MSGETSFARLVIRTLAKSPQLLVKLPIAAVDANLQILCRKRGRKVWVLSIEDVTYLPFVIGALKELPEGFFDNVMLVIAGRKFSRADVMSGVQSAGIAAELFIENWACAGLLRYDLFVATHQSAVAPFRATGPRVCTFHGLPAKGGTFVPAQWRCLDGAFLIGPLQEKMFEAFRTSSPEFKRLWSRRIGFIKCDRLLSDGFDRADVLKELGLDPERPTVLFAPTWEAGAALRTQGQEICQRLAQANWNTIVKLHPMSYFPKTEVVATGGVDWSEAFGPLESNRFRHAVRADASPLLAAADVLITDMSSITFEAILIDKPVISIDCPEFISKTVREMYGISEVEAREDLRYNCGRQAGVVARSLDELIVAIAEAIDDPKKHAAKRAAVREQLVFNPGRAAKAAADAFAELLGPSKPSS